MYDVAQLRQWAEAAKLTPRWTITVTSNDMLELLDDLELYKHILERIVAWDYPCRDEWCEAGEVAKEAFERGV